MFTDASPVVQIVYYLCRIPICLVPPIPLNNPWISHSRLYVNYRRENTMTRGWKTRFSHLSCLCLDDGLLFQVAKTRLYWKNTSQYICLVSRTECLSRYSDPLPPPRRKKGTVLMNIQSFYFLAFSPLSLAPSKANLCSEAWCMMKW